MKQLYTLFISVIFSISLNAQNATNFTCNDCSGGAHDLFTELDAGKVIVLCWVMPCSTCIPNSKTTYNVVNSYQTTNPGRVFFYLADDYGTTPCSSINSWANGSSVNISESAFSLRFSNSTIKMTDYGSSGMPKIVVLGGATHSVLFNSTVNTFNATNLQTAINNALAATAVVGLSSEILNVSLFPVPANNQTTLTINIKSLSNVKVEIFNIVGKRVSEIFNNQLNSGNNEIQINTSDLTNGVYFVKVNADDRNKIIKLIVSN
jgi:hypothetical protein